MITYRQSLGNVTTKGSCYLKTIQRDIKEGISWRATEGVCSFLGNWLSSYSRNYSLIVDGMSSKAKTFFFACGKRSASVSVLPAALARTLQDRKDGRIHSNLPSYNQRQKGTKNSHRSFQQHCKLGFVIETMHSVHHSMEKGSVIENYEQMYCFRSISVNSIQLVWCSNSLLFNVECTPYSIENRN